MCDFKTYPLHPGVLQHLAGTQAVFGVPNQKFGYEIFGTWGDVSPVFLWKLVFSFLDTLKQSVLEMDIITIYQLPWPGGWRYNVYVQYKMQEIWKAE